MFSTKVLLFCKKLQKITLFWKWGKMYFYKITVFAQKWDFFQEKLNFFEENWHFFEENCRKLKKIALFWRKMRLFWGFSRFSLRNLIQIKGPSGRIGSFTGTLLAHRTHTVAHRPPHTHTLRVYTHTAALNFVQHVQTPALNRRFNAPLRIHISEHNLRLCELRGCVGAHFKGGLRSKPPGAHT